MEYQYFIALHTYELFIDETMKDETGYSILISLELSSVPGKLELDAIALLTLINRSLL